MSATKADPNNSESFDVIIVGAGISGINCAYRLMKQQPDASFVILDGRDSIGGVWDQFRYPGVRSDSQIYTYGLAWHRWPFTKPIAQGSEIMEYLHDAVSKYHIDDHVRFQHKVSRVDWSSQRQEWGVTADGQGQHRRYLARWIIIGTGYVDYESPLAPDIPGLDKFKGRIVHPQLWPQNFYYAGQRLALIGSGATAVSLLPAIAKEAGHVTMIQRSPTYVAARPCQDDDTLTWLPLAIPMWFGTVSPGPRQRKLPANVPVDPHFTPRYDPWRQRLCLDPNGAFYQAFHRPNVRLITGDIDTVTEHGIRMRSGETVESDVIVTATGHRMVLGGSIEIQVDGKQRAWGGRFAWNGCMLDGVPNMMFMLGYTNNSWTVGADNTAMYLVRLMSYMKRQGAMSVVPRVPEAVAAHGTRSIWQLESTYVREAERRLPVCGNTGPWKPKNRPPIDWLYARWGNITADLDFSM
ncbi:Cyclohexanone monooxygenase [Apiospora phragmitis]|uniref:Cyclohexanone monooxygenase n=1 Tax=Apiospora phragmitis TaxID=2905665 RepID=A0ABR1VTT8_9PEZI